MKQHRQRGFSIIEMMLSLFLIALVVGLGILQTRARGTQSADPRALALILAAELRAARAKAMQDQAKVALVLPSDGGTVPHSRSAYRLKGANRGFSDRYVDFSKESSAYLAVASMPGLPTSLAPPPISGPAVTVEGWPRDATQDYIFMFGPDGRVYTNDLPLIDGLYRIVVAAGLEYVSTGAPAGQPTMTTRPSYFELSAASKPFTISITPGGAISARPGLPGSDLPPAGLTPQGAPPVTPVSFPNTEPEFDDIEVRPAPLTEDQGTFDAVLPVAVMGFEPRLEISMVATDPEGDPLTCQWSTTFHTHPDPGTFTVGGADPVQLTPSNRAHFIWYPPPGAQAGHRFTLSCTITDHLGLSSTLSGSAAIDVEMRNTGLVYYHKRNALGKTNLYMDFGSGPPTHAIRPFSYDADITGARVAPNGRSLVFSTETSGHRAIWMSQINGTSPEAIIDRDRADERDPAWNSTGTEVVYSEILQPPPPPPPPTPLPDPPPPDPPPGVPSERRIMKVSVANSGPDSAQVLTTAGWAAWAEWDPVTQVVGWDPDWSLDGTRIAFVAPDPTSGEAVFIMNADGTGITEVAPIPGSFNRSPRFSPDSSTLLFVSDRGGTAELYTVALSDLAVATQITSDGTQKLDCAWSPQYEAGTGGDIIYSERDGPGARLVKAELTAGSPAGTPRDTEVTGLDASGAFPDWGL